MEVKVIHHDGNGFHLIERIVPIHVNERKIVNTGIYKCTL